MAAAPQGAMCDCRSSVPADFGCDPPDLGLTDEMQGEGPSALCLVLPAAGTRNNVFDDTSFPVEVRWTTSLSGQARKLCSVVLYSSGSCSRPDSSPRTPRRRLSHPSEIGRHGPQTISHTATRTAAAPQQPAKSRIKCCATRLNKHSRSKARDRVFMIYDQSYKKLKWLARFPHPCHRAVSGPLPHNARAASGVTPHITITCMIRANIHFRGSKVPSIA